MGFYVFMWICIFIRKKRCRIYFDCNTLAKADSDINIHNDNSSRGTRKLLE